MGGAQKLFCHLSEWGRGELCFCPDVRIPVPLAPTHDHEDEVSPSGGAGCFSYRSYFSSLSKSFCALRGSAAPLIPVTHPGTGVVGNSVAQFICNKPMALWGKKNLGLLLVSCKISVTSCELCNIWYDKEGAYQNSTLEEWGSKEPCSVHAVLQPMAIMDMLQWKLYFLHSAPCKSRGTLTSHTLLTFTI